jgi:hypothetical protein
MWAMAGDTFMLRHGNGPPAARRDSRFRIMSSRWETRQVDHVSHTQAFGHFPQLRARGRKDTAQQRTPVEPFHSGQIDKRPRESFIYCNGDQQVTGVRYDNWKLVFLEQRTQGTLRIWAEPFVNLRVPKIFNLRTDPYERADITSNTYYDWLLNHVYLLTPAQDYVGKFLMTFKEYPQRQKAASFNLDVVLAKLKEAPAK